MNCCFKEMLMKIKLYILIGLIMLLVSCNNTDNSINNNMTKEIIIPLNTYVNEDTTVKTNSSKPKFLVLVLPPYDEIANAGISPNIQKYIEDEIYNDSFFTLIKFPYKQLMNVPYYNVYDKKYCKTISEKINADIIIMSKLVQITQTGNITTDQWNFQIRIYNTKTDKQIDSCIKGVKLVDREIKSIISEKLSDLISEIKSTY